jgi:hypothetical protein
MKFRLYVTPVKFALYETYREAWLAAEAIFRHTGHACFVEAM